MTAIVLLASCSYVHPLTLLKPLSGGEARLTGMEMPEYVREGLPYDVILRIDSEGTPQNQEGLLPVVDGGDFLQLAISKLLCDGRNFRNRRPVHQLDLRGKRRIGFVLRRCFRYQD